MTDGILLAEIQQRPAAAPLRHDDHRRGARAQPQHRLPARLPRAAAAPPARPEGDHHLGDDRPGALRRRTSATRPMVEVSGRTYPVEVRYRPLAEPDGAPASGATRPTLRTPGPDRGDRATPSTSWRREAPRRHPGVPRRRARDPRHRRRAAARCPPSRPDQLECCRSTPGCPRPSSSACSSPARRPRRIVLATNVAETSLTVPGIRYVVDPGIARICRYSRATKVQRLPIEPISQASRRPARGPLRPHRATASASASTPRRTSTPRPRFTDPEILRTNLASVILQMAALGLGDDRGVPVPRSAGPTRSDRRRLPLLHELGAIDRRDAS